MDLWDGGAMTKETAQEAVLSSLTSADLNAAKDGSVTNFYNADQLNMRNRACISVSA